MKTICFCASVNFYKHVNELADAVEKLGFKAVVPRMAIKMRESNDYDVASIKTWYKNPNDFNVKKELMDEHFKKVAESDITVIVNDLKHDIPGYIGPNVLMEIAIAYYLKKQIYVLNDVAPDNTTYEEVMGMGVYCLGGDITSLSLQK